MKTGRVANVSLPFLEGFSAKDRGVAEKSLARLEAKQLKSAASRARKAETILETFQGRLQDLAGAKKLTALRHAIEHERLGFRELWFPPQGLKRNYTKERRASLGRIDKLSRKLGINAAKVKRLQVECDEQLVEVFSRADGKVTTGFDLPKNFKTWSGLTPFHKLPLPWMVDVPPLDDPNDPHRWFLFQSPFFGFLFRRDILTSDNFTADWEHILFPSLGVVGNLASMDCNDAGSFDFAQVISESQIAFGFEPPTTGLLEVLVDAVCVIDIHKFTIEDEWGFSNGFCDQNSNLMMNVLHPDVPTPSLARMSGIFEDTDGDDSVVRSGDPHPATAPLRPHGQLGTGARRPVGRGDGRSTDPRQGAGQRHGGRQPLGLRVVPQLDRGARPPLTRARATPPSDGARRSVVRAAGSRRTARRREPPPPPRGGGRCRRPGRA